MGLRVQGLYSLGCRVSGLGFRCIWRGLQFRALSLTFELLGLAVGCEASGGEGVKFPVQTLSLGQHLARAGLACMI